MASGCHIEECSSFLLLGTDVAEGGHFHVTSGSLAVTSLFLESWKRVHHLHKIDSVV